VKKDPICKQTVNIARPTGADPGTGHFLHVQAISQIFFPISFSKLKYCKLHHFTPHILVQLQCAPFFIVFDPQNMGGATGGCGGGVKVPTTFGTSGVQGVQRGGPMKMIFASTTDSLYSVTDSK